MKFFYEIKFVPHTHILLSKARFCDFSHRGYGSGFFWDWLVKINDNSFQTPYSVVVEDFFEVRFQLIMLWYFINVLLMNFKLFSTLWIPSLSNLWWNTENTVAHSMFVYFLRIYTVKVHKKCFKSIFDITAVLIHKNIDYFPTLILILGFEENESW